MEADFADHAGLLRLSPVHVSTLSGEGACARDFSVAFGQNMSRWVVRSFERHLSAGINVWSREGLKKGKFFWLCNDYYILINRVVVQIGE